FLTSDGNRVPVGVQLALPDDARKGKGSATVDVNADLLADHVKPGAHVLGMEPGRGVYNFQDLLKARARDRVERNRKSLKPLLEQFKTTGAPRYGDLRQLVAADKLLAAKESLAGDMSAAAWKRLPDYQSAFGKREGWQDVYDQATAGERVESE